MKVSRRQFLKLTSGGIALLTVPSLISFRALATDNRLDATGVEALALDYVQQSNNAEQNCSNCALLKGDTGNTFRPCAIFGGKTVPITGWCSAWFAKP
uniref:high-potential iron-sulfur protein n=1 Tax=Thaumasiovibrio occultus TaxID=1891184 RepID=UPI000B364500|nr:high-potential iron-sulfur protein [Thaumasiovibrio occultus]